jgi:hypothetical protein
MVRYSKVLRPETLAAGCALLLSSLIAPSAEAITRHCRGAYIVQVVAPWSPTINGWHTLFPVPNFTAAGECGSTEPNRCRERARDRANRCMQEHWDKRWLFTGEQPAGIGPVICTAAAGVTGYNIIDLKRAIEIAGCCSQSSPIRNADADIPLRVSRHSYGDKGCGTGSVTLNVQSHTVRLSTPNDYIVNCRQLRQQQLCPGP